jgi:RHS repeat-associated protein
VSGAGHRTRTENRTYAVSERRVPIDGNGNLVGDGATNYTWDARDRLVSSGSATYGYDTGNLRTNMSGHKVLLDGIEEAREYGGSEMRYDHDPSRVDGLLAQVSNGAKGYLVTDAIGSLYAVVDSAGSVVAKSSYDAYGSRTLSGAQATTDWGFTGRRHDTNGLTYFRRRYYSPGNAIWLSPDPVRQFGSAYVYANDRPTVSRDPSGLLAYTVLGWMFGLMAVDASCWNAAKGQEIANSLITTYLVDAEMLSRKAFDYLERDENGNWVPGMFGFGKIFGHLSIASTVWACTTCPKPVGGEPQSPYHAADTTVRDGRIVTFLQPDYWRYPIYQRGARLHELVEGLLKGLALSGDPEFGSAAVGPVDEPGYRHQGRYDPYKQIRLLSNTRPIPEATSALHEVAASLAGMENGTPPSKDVSGLVGGGAAYLYDDVSDDD